MTTTNTIKASDLVLLPRYTAVSPGAQVVAVEVGYMGPIQL